VTGPFGQAEQDLMWLEYTTGRTPLGAGRPLLPHEIRAGVDFAAMDRDVQAAQAATQLYLDRARDVIVTELVNTLGEAATPEEAAKMLADFAATQPPQVRRAIAASGQLIARTLAELYNTGAAALLREGVHQGARPVDTVERAEVADMAAQARVAPSWLWSKLTQAATEAGGARAVGAAEVQSAVLGASIKGAYDLARQATNISYGQGRLAGIKAMPEPESVYASELLDSETCEACAAIDGTEFESLSDGLAAYPGGGVYYDCAGGDRCRGTLVVVWSSEENPTSS
jgi:hypothetical protein